MQSLCDDASSERDFFIIIDTFYLVLIKYFGYIEEITKHAFSITEKGIS